jgi:serine/arginine repetitive matrix protein 1
MQINLTGFLEKNTMDFMKELWNLLLSAQKSSTGIPQEFLEKKKQEILARKVKRKKIANI